jgi:hypothetical protein
MLYLTVASLLVAIIAVGVAIKQTIIAKTLAAKQDEQNREVHDWQLKHEAVAVQLSRINPHLQVQFPDHSTRMIYISLFPDEVFRRAIEHYIVEPDKTYTIFRPRKPTPLELRSPTLRETVTKVAAVLDACRKENPHVAKHFS